jgi:hypothetical protein
MMRVVTYMDPETGKELKFITSDCTLPPGIIVHLYRMRWNIEKVFDETENKLHENKKTRIPRDGVLLISYQPSIDHSS